MADSKRPGIPKVSKPSEVIRHRVREGLQQMILGGKVPSGSRLVQQKLAERFGVAQSVVRESLLELRALGLVEMRDHMGAFVSDLNERKLLEAYQVREALEGLAARLCCQEASRADIASLEKLAEQADAATQHRDIQAMFRADHDFHNRILEISKNEILLRLAQSYQIMRSLRPVPASSERFNVRHTPLVKAIKENRPDEAEQLMRGHIRDAGQHIDLVDS